VFKMHSPADGRETGDARCGHDLIAGTKVVRG
jgi:hypothetical protein